MARFFFRTILTASMLACCAAGALAQDTETKQPPDGGPDDSLRAPADRPNKPWRGGGPDDQRRFEKLSPEQRERFRENLQRWQQMPPEERQELRQEEQRRRQRMQREIEQTIKAAGLELTPDQRQVFALRYVQERRKIEEKLRREMEAKRRPMLEEMTAQLKQEFSAAKPSATPAPSASPSR